MIKTYKSKVSKGLLAIVFMSFSTSFIPFFIGTDLDTSMQLTILGLILIHLWVFHLFFNIRYTITSKEVLIKAGFIKYKPIPIEEIKKIEKSSNLISSPAASFDRISIVYGNFDEILISPQNKSEFINQLKRMNPEIEVLIS